MSREHRKKADEWFRRLLFKLRTQQPNRLPVFVRRAYEPDDGYGRTYKRADGKSWQIVVSTHIRDEITERIRPVTYNEMSDTLLHEWAHALAWTKKEHSKKWGMAYAAAYCADIGEK